MRDEVRNSVGLRFLDVSMQYKHHKQMFTKTNRATNSTVVPGISWDVRVQSFVAHRQFRNTPGKLDKNKSNCILNHLVVLQYFK